MASCRLKKKLYSFTEAWDLLGENLECSACQQLATATSQLLQNGRMSVGQGARITPPPLALLFTPSRGSALR